MKRKIISFFVCMLVIITAFPVIGMTFNIKTSKNNNIFNERQNEIILIKNSDEVEVLDQEQSEYSGGGVCIFGSWKLAQSFIPTLNSLTKIELKIFKVGEPAGLKISIQSDLSGEELTSLYVTADKISSLLHWHQFDLPDIDVTPGQTYYIVWDPDGENKEKDNICWGFKDDNPYKEGCAWLGAGDWSPIDKIGDYYNIDFCFRTYGLDETPNDPTIDGPNRGKAGEQISYTFYTVDPEGHNVYYNIYWGDDTNDLVGPCPSEENIVVNHTWTEKGEYIISVQAIDSYGAASGWSELSVTMPRKKVSHVNLPWQKRWGFPMLQRILIWLQ